LRRICQIRRLVLLTLLLALPACGLRLNATGTGTELFEDVELTGERVTGSELTVTVTLTPSYPVPVRVACIYENEVVEPAYLDIVAFEERATVIGETVLEPSTGSRPDEEGPERQLSYRFTAPPPGRYFLSCLTPAAPDNGMGFYFTIR
jgi:hypothetical protein